MGWANDTINRALAGAELPSSKKYGLKEADGTIVMFDEAPICWLEDALKNTEQFHVKDYMLDETKRQLQFELDRRKL